MELNKIYNEDCLEGMKCINPGSVDLILTDPPYGNMKGIDAKYSGYGRRDGCGHEWDNVIDARNLHEVANRILRKNGKMVLFSQEPYTNQLITNATANVPFNYRAIWEKNDFANALLSKKSMVSFFEDILIFSKRHDQEGLHPLRVYFKEVMNYMGVPKKEITKRIGQRADHCFRVNSTQFALCTEKTYNDLIDAFSIDRMDGFRRFDELMLVDEHFRKTLPSTFNLWDGKKYKSNILKYKKEYTGFHPTQKPVALLEDLIKTYSNPGDVVVDLTIGSGSTAIACMNTERNFIGFELDKTYYEKSLERIKDHMTQTDIFDLLEGE